MALPRHPGQARPGGALLAAGLQRAQAVLLFLQLQPSILKVCPDSSSSRSSVLISGPRNLKYSSWFYATMVLLSQY